MPWFYLVGNWSCWTFENKSLLMRGWGPITLNSEQFLRPRDNKTESSHLDRTYQSSNIIEILEKCLKKKKDKTRRRIKPLSPSTSSSKMSVLMKSTSRHLSSLKHVLTIFNRGLNINQNWALIKCEYKVVCFSIKQDFLK